MDDKLPAKTAKFTSLENLYIYDSYNIGKSGKSLAMPFTSKISEAQNILLYGPLDIILIYLDIYEWLK